MKCRRFSITSRMLSMSTVFGAGAIVPRHPLSARTDQNHRGALVLSFKHQHGQVATKLGSISEFLQRQPT